MTEISWDVLWGAQKVFWMDTRLAELMVDESVERSDMLWADQKVQL